MSADNWARCPRCARKALTDLAALRAKVDAAYGKVPVAEFDALRAEVERAESKPLDPTFREDYEFYGVEDGVLHISYRGSCNVCGLTHKTEHAEPLDVDGDS